MKSNIGSATVISISMLFAPACQTTDKNSRLRQLEFSNAESGIPPTTPDLRQLVRSGILPSQNSLQGAVPWGGANSDLWKAEAVLANAASEQINIAWTEADLADVLIAVPVKLFDSGYNPYGDGQTNSQIQFGDWTTKRPPMLAVLKVFTDRSPTVTFQFDKAWNFSQSDLEVRYRLSDSSPNEFRQIIIRGENVEGGITAIWSNIPEELQISFPGQLVPIFVRPSTNFEDWFQVYFRLPRHRLEKFIASVPDHLGTFPDGKPLLDPEGLKSGAPDQTPMDRAFDHQWPSHRYNVNNIGPNGIPKPYIPENVHARLFDSNGPRTAVGKGYTWVAEQSTPFKLMYTGFDERNVELEGEFGVPSGSGWHVMGDTITLINHEEAVPFLVGGGFSNPGIRFGINPPDHGFAYGLSDVVVLRLLFPGEAFVTVPTLFPQRDQDHQWYAIHTNHKFLAEEWVSPQRPGGDNPAFE